MHRLIDAAREIDTRTLERSQLAGVERLGHRVLVPRDVLRRALDEKAAASPQR